MINVPEFVDGKKLNVAVAKLLLENNLKISVAESLTGGEVAAKLVDIPGISKSFIEGIVAYANEAKMNRLGVSAETLIKFGAVSEETAKEMAEGLIKGDVTVSVSTTGIAGPTGGTVEKPVGTVCFGFCLNGKTFTERQIFSGTREEIRKKSTDFAFYKLYLLLSKEFSKLDDNDVLKLSDIENKDPLAFYVGRTDAGEDVFTNFKDLANLLIGGASGTGKSAFIRNILITLLLKNKPSEISLVLADPKNVEYNDFVGIKNVYRNKVLKTSDEVIEMLNETYKEMQLRYKRFKHVSVRNVYEYNQSAITNGMPVYPYVIIVIDEYADFIFERRNDFEEAINNLARLGKAAGIHLIMNTHCTNVDVVTGVIKQCFASRIAFSTQSLADSFTMIGVGDAANITEAGVACFLPVVKFDPTRVRIPNLSETKLKEYIEVVKRQ